MVVRDGFGEVVVVVVLQLEHEVLVGLEHEGCAVDGVLGVPGGIVAIDVPLEAALDPAPQRCADHDVPGVGLVAGGGVDEISAVSTLAELVAVALGVLGAEGDAAPEVAGLIVRALVPDTGGPAVAVDAAHTLHHIVAPPAEDGQAEILDGRILQRADPVLLAVEVLLVDALTVVDAKLVAELVVAVAPGLKEVARHLRAQIASAHGGLAHTVAEAGKLL